MSEEAIPGHEIAPCACGSANLQIGTRFGSHVKVVFCVDCWRTTADFILAADAVSAWNAGLATKEEPL